MALIAPSILSADFARIGEAVALAEKAGADLVHIDVMDGHFVPNLTLGPQLVASLRKMTRLPLDVHLMVEEPRAFIPAFSEAGRRLDLLPPGSLRPPPQGRLARPRARAQGGPRPQSRDARSPCSRRSSRTSTSSS